MKFAKGAPTDCVVASIAASAHLFAVPPAYQFRWRHTHPNDDNVPYFASNPPRGAVIQYYLQEPQTEKDDLVRVRPGTYTVRLTVGKQALKRKIVVTELPPDKLGRIRLARGRR